MNTALAEQLLALVRRDDTVRDKLLQEGRLFGDYADEMQAVHVENARTLDALITAHGWPGPARVGEEAARAAWRVAQHAICTPALQCRFRDVLKAAVEAGEAPARQLAMLEDRICFNEGRPQRYGTVFDWDATGELVCDVEQDADLDARRAAVGLPPYAETLAREQAAVREEGGVAPADYADYRRRADAWARKVGWRR